MKTKVTTTWDCEKPSRICSNNYASVPLSCECKVPKRLLRKQNSNYLIKNRCTQYVGECNILNIQLIMQTSLTLLFKTVTYI